MWGDLEDNIPNRPVAVPEVCVLQAFGIFFCLFWGKYSRWHVSCYLVLENEKERFIGFWIFHKIKGKNDGDFKHTDQRGKRQ